MEGVFAKNVPRLTIAVCAILIFWFFWPVQYHCSTELMVSPADLTLRCPSAKDQVEVQFRVRNALDHMKDPRVLNELCRQYVRSAPDSSVDVVRENLVNVRVMPLKEGDGTSWTVEAVSKTPVEARRLSAFYADSLVKYFENERSGLVDKMTAWFDQQIHHKRKRNEDVTELENNKLTALAEEQSKSLTVRVSGASKEWRTYK